MKDNKNPFKIVIDTSALRQDAHFKKESGRWIKTLAEMGHLEIHLPFVVENEIKTQLLDMHKVALIDSYNTFKKKIDSYEISLSFEKSIESLGKKVKNLFEKEILRENDFFKETYFILEEDPSCHTKNVLDNYFTGEGNFKSVKYRNDIPDAFIFEYVKKIALKDKEKIIVVVHDKGLRESISKIDNVMVYDDFEILVNDNEKIKSLLKEIKSKSFYKEITKFLGKLVYEKLFLECSYGVYDITDMHLDEWEFDSNTLLSINNKATIIENKGWNVIENTYEFSYYSKDEATASWFIDADLVIEHRVDSKVFEEHFKKWDIEHLEQDDRTYKIRENVRAKIEIVTEVLLGIDPSDYKSIRLFENALIENENFCIDVAGTGSIEIIDYQDRR